VVLNVNLNPDTIFVIKVTLTIKEITFYCPFDTVNKLSSLKKNAIVE
jgi:hypothetical protein